MADGSRWMGVVLSLDATWSKFGPGWVVDHRHVADVVAYAESRRELVVVSDRKAAAT